MLQVHYIQCLLCSCALLCSLSWSMIGFWCDLNSNNKYILAFPLYPNSYPIIYPLPCILTLFPNFIPWSYTLQPVWLAMVMMFMCLFITYSMWNNHSLQQCDVNISIMRFISVKSTYTSDPPENCQLNVKNAKNLIFFLQKNCQKKFNFF